MKNILQENMRRFKTKNLNEQEEVQDIHMGAVEVKSGSIEPIFIDGIGQILYDKNTGKVVSIEDLKAAKSENPHVHFDDLLELAPAVVTLRKGLSREEVTKWLKKNRIYDRRSSKRAAKKGPQNPPLPRGNGSVGDISQEFID